ncbi:MAG: sigma-70 family RNA polymerase sigma factor [Planctomycetes bacterium]|nr:sigma-70 family RNA polymerase sigma factor [Planctomycetota bacterium]
MSLSATPDHTRLLDLARAGDTEAFARLFERYRNLIRMTLRAQISAELRAKVDASDLLQETFLAATHSISEFAGTDPETFVRWLQVVAARRVADAYRRYFDFEKRDLRKEVPLEQLLVRSDRSAVRLVDQLADSASGPLSIAQRHEQLLRLADALETLPEHYREVLQLRYLEERPLNEIARQLGRTKGATAMLMARAIEKLRELLSSPE